MATTVVFVKLRDEDNRLHCEDRDPETGLLLPAKYEIDHKHGRENLKEFRFHGIPHNPDLDPETGDPIPAIVELHANWNFDQQEWLINPTITKSYYIMGKKFEYLTGDINSNPYRQYNIKTIEELYAWQRQKIIDAGAKYGSPLIKSAKKS